MTLEKLQFEMVQAMKNKDKTRKSVLSGMIDAVKKASMTNKGRVAITEDLVDEVLLKYKKMVQEQIDTCPVDRIEALEAYNAQMVIVAEFAPTLITDESKIEDIITMHVYTADIPLLKSNRGAIMKLIAPTLKGKADMSVVNKVLGGMLQ